MDNDIANPGQQKQAIEQVVDSLDRVVTALDQHAIVSITDPAGTILYVNTMFCQISGYSEDELIGENHRIIKSGHHDAEFFAELWRTISAGKNWKGIICNKRKNGNLYWVESTITPVFNDSGKICQYLSIRTDVTQLQLMQMRLQHRTKLRANLAQIAQNLLDSPDDEIRDALDFSLSSVLPVWNADAIAVYLLEKGPNDCDIDHCRAYPPLSGASVALLKSVCVERGELLARKPYLSLAEAGLHTAEFDPSLGGVLVPLNVSKELFGCLVIAFSIETEVWWENYRDYVLLLLDMIVSAVRRCQTTHELSASKERLRRGQVYANIGTWEWDIRSGALFWSERIAPLFGYPQGELETSYDNFLSAVHPDDRSKVQNAVDAAVSDDVSYDIEHRVVWPDGSVHWVLERGAVHRDESGQPLQMLGVVQDINERKLAELELEERQRQLRQAQDVAKLASWEVDFETGNYQASDTIYEIYGFDPAAGNITLNSFAAAAHPADSAIYIPQLLAQIEQSGTYDVSHRIIRADGEIRHVHAAGRARKDKRGKLLSLSGYIQDISNRVELEQRLRETEQRFIFAVEGAGDGVWDWNLKTNEVECSQLFFELLDMRTDKLIWHFDELAALLHPDDVGLMDQAMHDYLSGAADSYNLQLRVRCGDGSYKWLLCRGNISERAIDGAPLRMIGVMSDINDIKQKEQALVVARDEATEANQAKSLFLSNMSHELRTPLNAVLGFGQLLQMDGTLSANNMEYAAEITKAGQHLLDLINDVLDLAKVEAGRVMLSIEPVSLAGLLEDITALIRPLAAEYQVSLNLSEIGNAVVKADKIRLKQVLINLISNAIKYNRDGGSVVVSALSRDEQLLCISVEDTGRGIDPDKIEALFEPFNRLGAEGSGVEGTGIGLTLTKRLVEMMDGEIGVASVPGQGSRFWVELPIATEADNLLSLKHQGLDKNPGLLDGKTKTVLYIDDNPSNLKLVKNILNTVPDIYFIDAHNAELGLTIAKTTPLDMILVDINMPVINGYQVLKTLRSTASCCSKPIIAVTANAMPGEIAQGKAAGFDEYITKPFDIQYFKNMISTFLELS